MISKNTNDIFMKRKHLLILASVIWGIPGSIITTKGITTYFEMPHEKLWWLILITLSVLLGFFFMFMKIVNKYSLRIYSLGEKVKIWQAFPLRGWILLIFMMGLGFMLKIIPSIPLEFKAAFYSGLGPMLILSSLRFLFNIRNLK